MKALSFKQPWAWLMVKGYKDIENRFWRLPEKMKGQRIYVHASKTFADDVSMNFIYQHLKPLEYRELAIWFLDWREWTGAIVGEIDLIDCVTESDSKWFFGPYGFTVANPVAYEEPIPCKGMLGFFEVNL